ncbi:MAG: hypothetical protein AAF657_20145 [Acidobacteriota bacterium]
MSKLQLQGPLFNALQQFLPEELQNLVGAAADLTQPVDSGEFVVLQASEQKLEAQSDEIRLFDQPFTVSGQVAADLLVHDPGKQVAILSFLDPQTNEPVFDDAESLAAPPNQVLSELRLQVGADIEGTFEPPNTGVLQLSANLAAGGGLVYRHLRPSPVEGEDQKTTTRLAALTKLLGTSRPPALVNLRKVADGEIFVIESLVNLDFGITADLGGGADLRADLGDIIDAFEGTSAELQAHIDYSLQASLGYSLYQHMQLALGRFNVEQDDWVRLRIQRLRRSELTLGAKLSLQVQYDLAQRTLTSLFDRILELDPTTELMTALEQLQALRKEGGWEAVRDELIQKAGTEVDEFLQDNVWRQWLSDRDEARINELLGDLQEIVTAYDGLPQRIRDLWGSLLASADLGPESEIVSALRQIAAIDPSSPSALLQEVVGDDWTKALKLLESLTGSSVDELLVGRVPEVQKALQTAKEAAETALQFIDGLPERAISLIQNFAERTGIEGVVSWLRDNAQSLDQLRSKLEEEVNEQVRGLLSRLLGKAWDKIDQDDFEKLGQWLDRISAILEEKKAWEEKIRGIINRLEGELGFSLSLEISRLSERSALIDLEFDPTKSALRTVINQARKKGNARALLQDLPPGDTPEEAGFRLREAIFTSRRVRTSAIGFFFSLFNIQRRRQTVRTDEETIRVTQENDTIVRQGSYAGGVVQTLSGSGGQALAKERQLATWLSLEATGHGKALAEPYQEGFDSQELRLTFTREDEETLPDELAALEALLFDLGLLQTDSSRLQDLSTDPIITNFALDLRLREKALAALFSAVDEPGWNIDTLNAGNRWLDEPLIPGRFKTTTFRTGRVLAAVLADQGFQQHWLSLADFLANVPQENLPVEVGGKEVKIPRVSVQTDSGKRVFQQRGIGDLIFSRKNGLEGLSRAQEEYAGLATDKPEPKALRQLARHFSDAMASNAFNPGGTSNVVFPQWANPLFNLWLILARICRVAPSALDDSAGMAVLRWKAKAEDDWQEPLRWQASGALPNHSGAQSIFPFPPPGTGLEGVPAAAAGDQTVASKNSDVFHLSLDSASAQRISPSNRVFGVEARRNRTLSTK